MEKSKTYLTREEVPKYLQNNPRFKKSIEEGEKILNGSYDSLISTIEKVEEQNSNDSYKISTTSEVLTFSENGVSIGDKVINLNNDIKSLPKKDYDNEPDKKIKNASESQKNYKEVLNEGLQRGGLTDKLRKLFNTPLASEESIREWFEHGVSNKNAAEKMVLYTELKEDIYKECREKNWDTKKYNKELSRMQKRLFPELAFQEIE